MPSIITAKRERNRKLDRTMDNMEVMTIRVRRDRAKALREAQAGLKYPISQGALMDRAIDLLIADMRKKGEIR